MPWSVGDSVCLKSGRILWVQKSDIIENETPDGLIEKVAYCVVQEDDIQRLAPVDPLVADQSDHPGRVQYTSLDSGLVVRAPMPTAPETRGVGEAPAPPAAGAHCLVRFVMTCM